MSAAIVAQSDAWPSMASDKTMLVRMMPSIRRECCTSQGNFERSSAIRATSAASIAQLG